MRKANDRIVNTSGKLSIETLADPQQHAAAKNVKQAWERKKSRSKHDEPHQRRYAATCQNAVVDLQHEQGQCSAPNMSIPAYGSRPERPYRLDYVSLREDSGATHTL